MPSESHEPVCPRPLRAEPRTVRSLLSPEQLNAAIMRESARTDRNTGGDLAVVLFRLANPKKRALSTVRLIKTIIARIRVTDDLGWFDKKHLGLILPDTSANGAWTLAQHVCEAIARRGGARPHCIMYTYPAVGEKGQAIVRSSELTTPAAIIPPPAIRVAS